MVRSANRRITSPSKYKSWTSSRIPDGSGGPQSRLGSRNKHWLDRCASSVIRYFEVPVSQLPGFAIDETQIAINRKYWTPSPFIERLENVMS